MTAALRPGTYRLTVAMPPLRNDRRRYTDWRYLWIEVDKLFFYQEWTYAPDESKPTQLVTERKLYPAGSMSVNHVRPDESDKVRQLVEALVPVEDTAFLFLLREHGGTTAMHILDELIARGKTTLAEVVELAESVGTDKG